RTGPSLRKSGLFGQLRLRTVGFVLANLPASALGFVWPKCPRHSWVRLANFPVGSVGFVWPKCEISQFICCAQKRVRLSFGSRPRSVIRVRRTRNSRRADNQ